MIDFVSYVIFMAMGAVLGAILGRRVMRWCWSHSHEEVQNSWFGFALLVVMVLAYSARRWA